MRILIVDDDFVSRTKLEALLSEYGDCDAAEDGHQSLDMFEQAHGQSANYDLITMDIDMPGMSGHEVLSKIREWEEAHEVSTQVGNEPVAELEFLSVSPELFPNDLLDARLDLVTGLRCTRARRLG